MKKIINILLILFVIFQYSCFKKIPAEVSFEGLGTFIKIQLFDKEIKEEKLVFSECIEKIKSIEQWGSTFEPLSLVNFVNQNAQEKWVRIYPEMYFVLEVAKRASILTDGAFDITVKPLIDYYKIKEVEPGETIDYADEPPKEIMKKIGYENIILEPLQKKVYLKNGALIDLSGILKGYAVDELVNILKKHNIRKALINAGGNVYCLGTNEKNEAWVIGIRDPESVKEIKKTVGLQDTAIATSGGYERFIIMGGSRYSQIVDPRSGLLVEAAGSVTAISEKAILADIYSTAVFVDRSLTNKIKSAHFYLY